ncbi:hypothetical protein M422DRAFT_248619 [Sphaerobolus stellatus SS14]|nr:hypothetical protein M422DRAFT_248619 [Sphaerobolus stellatus SS14]
MPCSQTPAPNTIDQPLFGWAYHTPPYFQPYFYHEEHRLVTNADIRCETIRHKILEEFGAAIRDLGGVKEFQEVVVLFETSNLWWYVVNHHERVVEKANRKMLRPKVGLYWNHMYEHPSHRPLPRGVQLKAVNALRDAHAYNLCRNKPNTPFSNQELQDFSDFFDRYKDNKDSEELSIAQVIVISFILYNVDYFQNKARPALQPRDGILGLSKLMRVALITVCCGIPPEYDARFKAARVRFETTFQKETFESFITQLLNERSNMNIVAGLLLSLGDTSAEGLRERESDTLGDTASEELTGREADRPSNIPWAEPRGGQTWGDKPTDLTLTGDARSLIVPLEGASV